MWYSHKFNWPGLRYEVVISILGGYIVEINAPFSCGSWPDIKIFKERLIHALPQGEEAELIEENPQKLISQKKTSVALTYKEK